MRKAALTAILLSLIASLSFAQSSRGPSTPEERARFVKIAHQLEAEPLNEALYSEREWALKWLIEIPDVSVSICGNALSPVLKEKTKNDRANMTVLYTMAAGAFAIEHPEQAKDNVASAKAALESIIRAYDNVIKSDPKAKLKSMEQLKQKLADGKLIDVASQCREES